MSEGFDPAAVPVRKGRRDPALAQQLERRERHDVVPLDDLNPEYTEESQLGDDQGPQEYDQLPDLLPGDVVACKVTHEIPILGGKESSWFTYGIQSRIQPGEEEEDA